jgi:imidazolonepropionase-like amidohydrolase
MHAASHVRGGEGHEVGGQAIPAAGLLAIRFGVLHDQLGEPKRNGVLTIAAGRVSAVGGPDLPLPDDAVVMEAACVIPGLINAHAHLEQDARPDAVGMFASTTATQRAIRAAHHAQQALRSGVTTLRDLGASNRIAIDIRDAIRQGALPGPAVLAAGRVICMTGGHGAFVGRQADGADEIRLAVREQRRDGADLIKLIATGGVLTAGAVPGSAELSRLPGGT